MANLCAMSGQPDHLSMSVDAILSVEDGPESAGDRVARIPREGAKPRTLPVVCRGLRNLLKHVVPKITRSSPKSTAMCALAGLQEQAPHLD
jgi:hypothetical protein